VTLADQWALLGIEPTDDKRAVRMAYTQRLKETDVDSDPAAFIRLRKALDEALFWGTSKPDWEEEDWGGDLEQWPDIANLQFAFQPGAFDLRMDEGEWRPDLPAASEDRLGMACAELDRLLFADEEPDPEQIAALGGEIMSDPELVNVDRAAETERWLAQLIPAGAPRSDPLIEPAVARFGWDRWDRHWRRDEDVEQALSRREAIQFLARCQDIHVQRVALEELRRPARSRLEWDNLSLAREVREFLALIDTQHPLLHRDLNADSVAWWRSYLAGPYLPASFWSLLLMVPAAVTLFGLVVANEMGGNVGAALLLYPPSMLVTYAAILVSARIRMKVRQRTEQFWLADHDSTGVPALMLVALLLPAVTAFAPDTGGVGMGSGLLALLILAAVWWRMLPRGRLASFSGTGFLPGVAAICVLLLPLAVPRQSFLKTLVPLAILCLLGYWSFGEVQLSLVRRGARLAAMGAAAILCMVAGFLAVRGVPNWPPQPWVLVLAPVAIIASHLATSASMVHLWEWPLRICAAFVYFFSGAFQIDAFGFGLVLAIYAYGLVYSFLKLILAAIEELKPRWAESP
jgi:hypothetical protein